MTRSGIPRHLRLRGLVEKVLAEGIGFGGHSWSITPAEEGVLELQWGKQTQPPINFLGPAPCPYMGQQ